MNYVHYNIMYDKDISALQATVASVSGEPVTIGQNRDPYTAEGGPWAMQGKTGCARVAEQVQRLDPGWDLKPEEQDVGL